MVLVSVAGLATPLHGERYGHRQAGDFLREQAGAYDEILDPSRMAGFLAGLDARNLWPHDHPPPCSAIVENFHDYYPQIAWLVLSDRLVEPWEVEEWNAQMDGLRLTEVKRFPLARGPNSRWHVRVYRLETPEGRGP